MVCMSAFFTAPFNMYANAGRLRRGRTVTRGAPLKRPSERAPPSFPATARALIDGVRGRRQMTGFVISFSLFLGVGGRLRLETAEEI